MDWRKLRTLDLGDHGPQAFFTTFRGHVSNLKSFSCMLSLSGALATSVDNVRVIGDFLDSIQGLEELCIKNATGGFFPILWIYVRRHGSTLLNLKTSNLGYQERLRNWNKNYLAELLESCSHLNALSIDLNQEFEVSENHEKKLVWVRNRPIPQAVKS
jgi:hypothetical protein